MPVAPGYDISVPRPLGYDTSVALGYDMSFAPASDYLISQMGLTSHRFYSIQRRYIKKIDTRLTVKIRDRSKQPGKQAKSQIRDTERKKSSSMGDNGPEPVSTDCNKKLAIAAFVLAMIDFFIFFIIL